MTARMDVAVSIRNAVKRYGATTALAGVSLDITNNAFFTLLGVVTDPVVTPGLCKVYPCTLHPMARGPSACAA